MHNIYSVSQLNGEVKKLLESGLGVVWLSGEISNLVMAASGHWYLTLKDPRSQVRCAMFRGNNRNVKFRPANGQQVLVRAKLSLYEARGDYQLILESMAPEGDGLLAQKFDELKFRLAAEGLFSTAHKKALPPHPTQVGLITSATGAAIHDLLSVLKRRNPLLKVIIYPSQVQGQGSAEQLVAALRIANQRNEVDLLVIGRGGGSMEDLWSFNEETVARAIFASELPVISAVGHEVDTTIADYVADVRAATPSAAAELLSQNSEAWQSNLRQLYQRAVKAMNLVVSAEKQKCDQLVRQLHWHEPVQKLQQKGQKLDELEFRLRRQFQGMLIRQQERVHYLNQSLHQASPANSIHHLVEKQERLNQRLASAVTRLLKDKQHTLQSNAQQLNAVSPLATLSRGDRKSVV